MASTSEWVRAWRLVKERHADSAFDGEGARLYGGRWNSPGKRAVYVSGSMALAALETLVHLDTAHPLPRFVVFSVSIPGHLVTSLDSLINTELPPLDETRKIGDHWLEEGRNLALSIPSIIIPQETNLLLNPSHPEFAKLRILPPVTFTIDARLRR